MNSKQSRIDKSRITRWIEIKVIPGSAVNGSGTIKDPYDDDSRIILIPSKMGWIIIADTDDCGAEARYLEPEEERRWIGPPKNKEKLRCYSCTHLNRKLFSDGTIQYTCQYFPGIILASSGVMDEEDNESLRWCKWYNKRIADIGHLED